MLGPKQLLKLYKSFVNILDQWTGYSIVTVPKRFKVNLPGTYEANQRNTKKSFLDTFFRMELSICHTQEKKGSNQVNLFLLNYFIIITV